MAVKIRLQRGGAKGKPMYRLVVADSRAPRDGRFVEVVGTYNPTSKIEGEQVKVKLDRADYWLGVGAQPSDTARSLINRARREAAARGTSQGAAQPVAAAAQASEVANRSAAASPTGTPVAGGAEEGATAKAPTEAEQAGEENNG